MKEIPPIPPIPKEIIHAINNDNLAIFIGAGVSRIIGCKGWDELAFKLVNACYLSRNNIDKKCINYKEKESLSNIKDHKKTITICHSILKDNDLENIFYLHLKASLEAKDELQETFDIYNELSQIPALFITTNADELFDNKFHESRIQIQISQFNNVNIDKQNLYHIHGSIRDKQSLVFTVDQYLKRYQDIKFQGFLNEIFSKYTILFVGYGLNEFELLDYVITKNDIAPKRELRHYILLPFYSDEVNILKFEQSYFSKLGINVLGYSKDENGYEQLYYILQRWKNDIKKVSSYIYKTRSEIESITKDFDAKKVNRILQYIKTDKDLERYFFDCLSKTDTPQYWLKYLIHENYFRPEKNPVPVESEENEGFFSIPFWMVLRYLENLAIYNSKTPRKKITKFLVEFINSTIDYQKSDKKVDNYHTDLSIIKIISLLPIESITANQLEYIKIALESRFESSIIAVEINKSIIPKLIKHKRKEYILTVLHIITDFKKDEYRNEYKSILKEFWLSEIFKQHKKEISIICGLEAIDIGISKIQAILREDESQFNNVWIPTIEDHSQTTFKDRYEYQLVYFIRDILDYSKPEDIFTFVQSLLEESHPIFKRIAIHTIDYHYSKLKNIFWKLEGNPLDIYGLKHELYVLFENNCGSFSDQQIGIILSWIETRKYYTSQEINKQIANKQIAYSKKEWLSSLLKSSNDKVQKYYKKYDDINPEPLSHPGFDFWSESIIGEISPIEANELKSKSNSEIVDVLNNFQEKSGYKTPTQRGLSDQFRICVTNNPKRFVLDLTPFLNIHREHQHSLLWGLADAWRNNKDFNWQKVFQFLESIINDTSFWDEEYIQGFNYRNWIVSQIAGLINIGAKNKQHTFDKKYINKAIELILEINNKTTSEKEIINDIVTHTINSPKGKIYECLIDLALLYASEFDKKKEDEKWPENIKKCFDKRLKREYDPSLEYSAILGIYLLNFLYLDNKWVKENFNTIFIKNNDSHWDASFTGYLFSTRQIYKDVYFLFRDNKHYEKAINHKFTDQKIIKQLIQHFCVGYIEGWENFNIPDSYIKKIINQNSSQFFNEIINFFVIKEKPESKVTKKIKPLLLLIFKFIEPNLDNGEYQAVASNLLRLLSSVNKIDDEIIDWLNKTIKYVAKNYNTPFLIEAFLVHVDKSPEEVGKIYIKMLESNVFPDYDKENIRSIVNTIYEKGFQNIANSICNLYLSRGFDFLTDVFEKYNKTK